MRIGGQQLGNGVGRRVAPEQLWDRSRAMADDRRLGDECERFLPVFEPQADRRVDVGRAMATHLLDRERYPLAQIGRRRPRPARQHAAHQRGDERTPPPELPQPEQQEQHRHDHEGRARSGDINDVGDERRRQEGKTKSTTEREPRACAPQLGHLADQPEGANREDRALENVVLDRHARRPAAPRQAGREHQHPRDDEQQDRRGEKAEECPLRLSGAAELRQQQRHEEQLVKSAHPGDALLEAQVGPRQVGPQHAGHAEPPEQQRQAAGRRHHLTPHRGRIEGRNERNEPEHDQDGGRRRRPRQRDGDGGDQPVGDPGEPRARANVPDHGGRFKIAHGHGHLGGHFHRAWQGRATPTDRVLRASDRCPAPHRAGRRWRGVARGRLQDARGE